MPSIPKSVPKPKGQWINSPLLGGAASIIGGISQGLTNRKNRQWSEQQWERQNQYNHPTAWRQRMEEAGINPFYTGQSGTAAGTVTSPSTKASELDMGAYFAQQKLGLDTKITDATVQKIQAETEYQQLQNEYERGLKQGSSQFQDPTKKGLTIFTNAKVQNKLDNWEADLKQKKVNKNLTEWQASNTSQNIEYLKSQILKNQAQNLPYQVLARILNYLETLPAAATAKKFIDNALRADINRSQNPSRKRRSNDRRDY